MRVAALIELFIFTRKQKKQPTGKAQPLGE
jgi:hypothetical protein